MATTEHFRNGGGTTFSFVFPILANSDLNVEIFNDTTKVWDQKTENTSGQTDNDYTISNTNVVFNSATPSGTGNVHIYRKTNVDSPAAVYAAGSSIRAIDLNDNQTQVLYSTQETSNQLVRETDLKDSIVTSAKIVDNTIVDIDINANAEIAVSKLADGSARQLLQTDAAGSGVEWSSNIYIPGTLRVSGNVDLDSNLNVDGTTTLDGTTVDGVLDVNGSATIDNVQINSNEIDTTSGNLTIDSAGGTTTIDDVLNVSGNVDLNANLNVDGTTTLDGTTVDGNLSVNGNATVSSTVTAADITGNAVVTSGASTSDTKVYSAKRAGEIFYEKGTLDDITSGDTWASDDNKLATTAAIDARIIGVVDDVGGFVPIANETSFPTENPDINISASVKGGTIVSVQTASTNLVPSGTTVTIANGRGSGLAVIITGVSTTIPQGFGFLVETTGTDHTYAFHRLVPKATEVTTVAGNIANVNTVAGSISNVNAVGTNISNVNSVAGNASNINSAVSNASNINAAVSNATNINTVANNNTNISTVAGISANVTTVANDGTDIGNVSGSIANVNTTAGSISNVNTVAGSIGNVNTTAGSISNVNTVAGNNTNINTVAGISGNVTTVAGISGNVTTVAGSIPNVNTTAGAIANVNTVAGSIANVNTVGSNITNVTNASTYLNNFLSLYLGEHASNPTLDALGNAITEGDLYWNNVTKQLRLFNGSTWQGISDNALELLKIATGGFEIVYTAAAGNNNINLGGLAITGAHFSNESIPTNKMSLGKGSATYNLGGI